MPVFSHVFELPFSPSEAMPLFTPRGEEYWVPGWAPRYVDPACGTTVEGMIFATEEDSVWWTCLRWNPEGEVRYLRISPRRKAARVTVQAAAAGDSGSQVVVSYDWHALSPEGQAEIDALTPAAFAASIDRWRGLILSAQT